MKGMYIRENGGIWAGFGAKFLLPFASSSQAENDFGVKCTWNQVLGQ